MVRKGAGKGLALLPTEGGPFLHKARWRSKNHNACQPLERSLRLHGRDHRKRLPLTLTASKAKKSRSSPQNWVNKGRLLLGRGGPQGEIPLLNRLQRRPSLHTLQGACRHGDLSKLLAVPTSRSQHRRRQQRSLHRSREAAAQAHRWEVHSCAQWYPGDEFLGESQGAGPSDSVAARSGRPTTKTLPTWRPQRQQ